MNEQPAGRELDALIATRIFGYTLDYEFADIADGPTVPELRDQYDEWGILPHYSTETGDAWLIVEQLRADYMLDLSDHITFWTARFTKTHGITARVIESATAPLAICRAALKTLD